jgi:hypothetical protein
MQSCWENGKEYDKFTIADIDVTTNSTLTILEPNFSTSGDVTKYHAHRFGYVTVLSEENRKFERTINTNMT